MRRLFGLLFLCSIMSGCDALIGGSNTIDVFEARLEAEDAITAPDTVRVGQRFEVTVRTMGGSSCVQRARTESAQVADAFVIRPFNQSPRGANCLTVIVPVPHTVETAAPTSGPFLIRAFGVDNQVAERTVVVR